MLLYVQTPKDSTHTHKIELISKVAGYKISSQMIRNKHKSDLYENHKTMLKEIKDTNKHKASLSHTGRLNRTSLPATQGNL